MKRVVVTEGVVACLNGKYWGMQHGDGSYTHYDFGPIENAKVSDPRHARSPTDLTWKGSADRVKLSQARLVPVKRTVTYEIDE